MQLGMLWFDNDPHSDLPAKVTRAAAYYRRKYGRSPHLCFVNPVMLDEVKKLKAGDVVVEPSPAILPNHFWLGCRTPSADPLPQGT